MKDHETLLREDLAIQFEAAQRSVAAGQYAAARAELGAAKMMIDAEERRRAEQREATVDLNPIGRAFIAGAQAALSAVAASIKA